MGFYIEVPNPTDKATQIEQHYGAEVINQPTSFADVPEDKMLICVMQNGLFDAAGVIYDSMEFKEFTSPHDLRFRTWLLMDRAKVLELLPALKTRLGE